MRVFRLHTTSTDLGGCGCYDRLWDIEGDHQGIEGWPFVSNDEIRRYFANRDAAILAPQNTSSMEEPQSDPAHPPISGLAELDIHGHKWGAIMWGSDRYRRNPLCTGGIYPNKSSVGVCLLNIRSKDFPHSCDKTGRITCKKDVAVCNFTCYNGSQLREHLKKRHGTAAFGCTVPGCKRVGEKAFTRKDNLTQHIRKVHKRFIPRVQVRFSGGRTVLRNIIDQEPRDPRLGTFELAAVPSGDVNGEDASAEASEYNAGGSSAAFERVEEEEYRLE